MFTSSCCARTLKSNLVLFGTQTKHQGVTDKNVSMNKVSESELLASSNIGDVHFARQLDCYFLFSDLTEVGIVVSSDSIFSNHASDTQIVFHYGKDFGISKLVARDLCL